MAFDKNLINVGKANFVFFGGTDVGGTLGGIGVSANIDTFPVEVDQSLSAVQFTLLEKQYLIKVPMAESSIDNIATFFTADKSSSVTGTTKLILNANDFPSGATLGFTTDLLGPSKVLHFFFHDVQLDSVEETTINKGSQAVWAANFRAFPLSSNNEAGYVYLKTA